MVNKILLTPKEVGQLMGISKGTVYKLIRTGQLNSIKIGRSRRIPFTVIEKWVEERSTQDFDVSLSEKAIY